MRKVTSILGRTLLILIAIVMVIFFLRFVIGGSEDDWICVDGQWVKHGFPAAPQPAEACE